MGTTIRSELSPKNPYWIDKHRYYELKHFCLQYPLWRRALNSIDGFAKKPINTVIFSNEISDPTERAAEAREFYKKRMSLVEDTAKEAGGAIWSYILKAVTLGVSYDTMASREVIPYSRDIYYTLYRKFFWLLSRKRG